VPESFKAGAWLLMVVLASVPARADATAVLPSPMPGYVPDLEEATCRLDPSGSWHLAGEAIAIRLAALDDARRAAYLRRAAGTESDPFAAKSVDGPAFVTFHVTVENGADGSLVFEPQRCWLRTASGQVRVPLDPVSAGSAYRLRDGELPPAYRPAIDTLFGSDVILRRGESAGGLLVYEGVRRRTKGFIVELHASTSDGEHRTCKAAYRREKKKDREKAESQ